MDSFLLKTSRIFSVSYKVGGKQLFNNNNI